MKLRRIMSAMLATALVTSTVAFAEDVSTEGALGVNFTIENGKGTYTFTDEELAAFVDYNIEVNGSSEDTTFVNEPCGIFGEDSRFIVADGTSFSLNEVFRIEFELIDIEKDADGSTSFRQLNTLWNRNTFAQLVAIWGPCPTMGPDFSNTLEASNLIEIINKHGEFELDEEFGRGPEYAFTYDDVDMVVVAFHINDELDEDGYAVYPSSDSNYRVITQWLLTEQGADMLNEANAGANAPETPEAPASDYEVDVTEALTAEDIADVIAANADSNVIINGDNGVSFKFAKGTMAAVDGVEAYDFTSTISTDLADAVSDKLTEDNFVMSIDYAYSGKLPAKAEITIPVGVEYAGKTLYYSRVLENGVKLIDSAEVDENGFITVTQDSCSDYLLTTEDISADNAGCTDGADGEDKNSADTGAQGVAAAAGIALAAGAAVLFSRKRK